MAKTAVIIIHGIGEQHPMDTVRSFVRFFAGNRFRSKPDRESDLFELRRLSTYASDEDPVKIARAEVPGYPADTVFYEYYWAYHYRNTQLGLVLRWGVETVINLFRTGYFWRLRPQVLFILAAWLVLLLCAIVFICSGVWDFVAGQHNKLAALKIITGFVLPGILALVRPVFLGWIGDAARYFGRSPDNPIERQEIRAKGIALLQRLHDQEDAFRKLEYDRIVLVGHSLGSVIAYDLITHYWAKVNTDVQIDATSPSLESLERLTKPHNPTSPVTEWAAIGKPAAQEYQQGQTALVKEVSTLAWRISDLVTLGSPLTYARFLIDESAAALEDRQVQRELPTCPPVRDLFPDKHGRQSFVYSFSPVTAKDKVVGHHAAPFLFTRWTNFYFERDPIGGPLRPFFGWGIQDFAIRLGKSKAIKKQDPKTDQPVPVAAPIQVLQGQRASLLDALGGAHLRYWQLEKNCHNGSLVRPKFFAELLRIVSREPPKEPAHEISDQLLSSKKTNNCA